MTKRMTATTAQHDITSDENATRRRHGQDVLSQIDGRQGEAVINFLADISPGLGHHMAAFALGDVYDRPGLDARSHQLVTLGILTALGGCELQLRIHIGAALNVGVSRDEIIKAFLHSAVYAGFPRALNATLTAREVFADRDNAD